MNLCASPSDERTASKKLGHADDSGFRLVKELLGNDENFAINLDRLAFDATEQCFVVFEFQKCEAEGVSPHTSHPSRYWHRCWRKYLAIWRFVQKLEATFYVVNYAEAGSAHADEIRIIRIQSLNRDGIKKSDTVNTSREKFGAWLRELNRRCQGGLV